MSEQIELPGLPPSDSVGIPLHGDQATLAYPFFVLRNSSGQGRIRNFQWRGHSIQMTASVLGYPTMRDREILIFCISKLLAEVRQERNPGSRVEFSPAELFRFVKQSSGYRPHGKDHNWLKEGLRRLTGSTIYTNIPTGGRRTTQEFSMIERYEILSSESGRAKKIAVWLSEWCYRSILARETHQMAPEYLAVRKPLERRLYELATRHCQGRRTWGASIGWLILHTGSLDRERDFKRRIEQIQKDDRMPEYKIQIFGERVIFTPRKEPE